MSKVKYKTFKQLREKYPDIALEYTRNLRKVKDFPSLISYQKLYNTVLKLDEEISPEGKAKLLSPLTDAVRAGDRNALNVISLRNNDTRFETALQEYVAKMGERRVGRNNFSPRGFSNAYRRATQNLRGAVDGDAKREALFEIANLLHKTYRTDGIDDEFKELLFNQREVFETRISDHDAALNLRNIRAGITQGPADIPEKLDGTEDFVYAEIPELETREDTAKVVSKPAVNVVDTKNNFIARMFDQGELQAALNTRFTNPLTRVLQEAKELNCLDELLHTERLKDRKNLAQAAYSYNPQIVGIQHDLAVIRSLNEFYPTKAFKNVDKSYVLDAISRRDFTIEDHKILLASIDSLSAEDVVSALSANSKIQLQDPEFQLHLATETKDPSKVTSFIDVLQGGDVSKKRARYGEDIKETNENKAKKQVVKSGAAAALSGASSSNGNMHAAKPGSKHPVKVIVR